MRFFQLQKAISFEEKIQTQDEDLWLTCLAVPLKNIDFDDLNEGQHDMFGAICANVGCFT